MNRKRGVLVAGLMTGLVLAVTLLLGFGNLLAGHVDSSAIPVIDGLGSPMNSVGDSEYEEFEHESSEHERYELEHKEHEVFDEKATE